MNKKLMFSAVLSTSLLIPAAFTATARADQGPATKPADAARVTGTAADIKGTSNTIGGRDIPAPAIKHPDMPADHSASVTPAPAAGGSVDVATPAPDASVTAHTDVATPTEAVRQSDAPKAVQDVLADTVNDAANDGHFKAVESHLSKADRDRMTGSGAADVDTAALNQQILAFRQDWQARYHEQFHIGNKNEPIVFNNVTVTPASADAHTAAAVVSGGSDVPANHARVTGTAADINGTSNRIGGRDIPAPAVSDSKEITSDRLNVAFATGHADASRPGVVVPLVREGSDWKIVASDGLSGAGLRTRLQHQFAKLDENKDKWPADVNDAYRVVSDHVLNAITREPHTANKADHATAQP